MSRLVEVLSRLHTGTEGVKWPLKKQVPAGRASGFYTRRSLKRLNDTVSLSCECLHRHCLPASSKCLLFITEIDASLLYLSCCFISLLSCRLLLQASEFAQHYFSSYAFSDKQSVLSYRKVAKGKLDLQLSLLASAVYRQFRWSVALKWCFWQVSWRKVHSMTQVSSILLVLMSRRWQIVIFAAY